MWNRLQQKIPKSWNTTRIENRFGGGIPDVHVCVEGLPFWIELKVTKTNRVNVSAHQVAWNFSYSQSGGVSFFLVEASSTKNLYLFDGVHGRGLAEHGLKSGGPGSGSVGSGSVGLGSVGSGSGTMVPCLWSGSVGSGLLVGMLDIVRGRVGVGSEANPALVPLVSWPGPGV
jgi:hypothetical protein